MSNFIKKNQVFGHKKPEKNTRIFLNTDINEIVSLSGII
jgi:hypothetical protein